MKDKSIINIPIYRTKPKEVEVDLFPPTRPDMIKDVIYKIDRFQCSQAKNIIVENTGKNYTLEVVKIKATDVDYNHSHMVLIQMTVQKRNFGEEYFETTPMNVIPMSDSVKLGSTSYFFILYPIIVHLEQDSIIKSFWNVFVYDDPNKDSEDFIKVVKKVLKEVLGEVVRNIKYKDFLNEIEKLRVLDNISASILTIEDVDQNYKTKYSEWLIDASLRKKNIFTLRNLPSDKFKELYECQDVNDVNVSKKIFKLSHGFKQYTLKRERKIDVKTMHEKLVDTVESCFNETITIGDGEETHIYDEVYIVNNVGPIIHKYMS